MAKVVTNECCNCAVPAYPCIGDVCPLTHVERFYCDKCKEETVLYEYDGKELCAECLLEIMPKVKGSESYEY